MIDKCWKVWLIFQKVARKEGISVRQVVSDIETVIQEAYTLALQENNSSVIEAWKAIPCKGELPTAVELVIYLSDRVRAAESATSMFDGFGENE